MTALPPHLAVEGLHCRLILLEQLLHDIGVQGSIIGGFLDLAVHLPQGLARLDAVLRPTVNRGLDGGLELAVLFLANLLVPCPRVGLVGLL